MAKYWIALVIVGFFGVLFASVMFGPPPSVLADFYAPYM